jgi:hypothetical protein
LFLFVRGTLAALACPTAFVFSIRFMLMKLAIFLWVFVCS